MKKFSKKALIYLSIVMLYLLWGEITLYKMRENIPVNKVIEQQFKSTEEKYYARQIFEEYISNYKYEMLKLKEPDIQILGQSIVLQFRDFMFKPYNQSFYNAGLMIRNLRDLNTYVDLIEKGTIHKPKFMVLGVDHLLFKKTNKLNNLVPFNKKINDETLKAKAHLRGIQQFLLTSGHVRYKGKILGFGKKGVQGSGYRKDGSCHNKEEVIAFINDSAHLESSYYYSLQNRIHPFTSPLIIDTLKANYFYTILKRLKQLDIEILMYFAPLSDTFYKAALNDQKFNTYWHDFLKIQDYLMDNNFNIIPFSTPSELGFNDYYMTDAVHPGSIITAHQFLNYMLINKHKFNSIKNIDLNYTDSLLQNTTFPLTFLQDTLIPEIKKYKNKINH